MKTILKLKGVSFAYQQNRVLDDVSVELRSGEFVALVGPNGAGKSTFVQVSLGLLQAQDGEVELFGKDPTDRNARSEVGFVPQRPFLGKDFPATVREVVAAGGVGLRWWRRSDAERIDEALAMVDLTDHADSRIGAISGGQQQRAFIAKALVRQPKLLVLDEPTAGVDAEQQERFAATLGRLRKELGACVLLVSHDLAAVESRLDRVIVLRGTVRFDGPPSALIASGVNLGAHGHDLPRWLEELS